MQTLVYVQTGITPLPGQLTSVKSARFQTASPTWCHGRGGVGGDIFVRGGHLRGQIQYPEKRALWRQGASGSATGQGSAARSSQPTRSRWTPRVRRSGSSWSRARAVPTPTLHPRLTTHQPPHASCVLPTRVSCPRVPTRPRGVGVHPCLIPGRCVLGERRTFSCARAQWGQCRYLRWAPPHA